MKIRLSRRQAALVADVLQMWIDEFSESAFEVEDELVLDLIDARHEAQVVQDKIRRKLYGRGTRTGSV